MAIIQRAPASIMDDHTVINNFTMPENNPTKTVVCHFYNEEFLLPWWLKHHKHVFDHGIMIDYHSTDRSMELIREICPDWEIRYTRNKYFDSAAIDKEVMNVEQMLGGWRMCLNVTEFLYGNTDHLELLTDPTQYLIGNYVFVDMEDAAKETLTLDHNFPLHQQRHWGYDDFINSGQPRSSAGGMSRMHRSIHNYPLKYTGGRHFGDGKEKSFDDLVIFYYGHADNGIAGTTRKTQIHSKISELESSAMGNHHHPNPGETMRRVREGHRPLSRDLAPEIATVLEHNRRITGQDF